MIVICEYQEFRKQDSEEDRRLRQLLSSGDEEDDDYASHECFWLPTQFDMKDCSRITQYLNRVDDNTSCMDATGKTIIYLGNDSFISSIPFSIMWENFKYKNEDLLLEQGEDGGWQMTELNGFAFELEDEEDSETA